MQERKRKKTRKSTPPDPTVTPAGTPAGTPAAAPARFATPPARTRPRKDPGIALSPRPECLPARPLSFRRRIPRTAAKPVTVPVASRRIPRTRKPSCPWFFAPPRSRSRVSFSLSEASNVTALPTFAPFAPLPAPVSSVLWDVPPLYIYRPSFSKYFGALYLHIAPLCANLFSRIHSIRTSIATRFPIFSRVSFPPVQPPVPISSFLTSIMGFLPHFCIISSCSRARSRLLFPTSFHFSISPFPSRPARSSFSRKALYF